MAIFRFFFITSLVLLSLSGHSQVTITSIDPLIVERFDTVTIKGTGLSGAIEVFFGNQRAKSFAAESDTMLKAVINHGAAGKVKVKTASTEAESAESILVSYNSDLLFVGSYNEDSLNVIHPEDGKVIGKIRLPRTVEYFCILPDNKTGFASDPVKDSLYEISLTEWRVTRQIKVDDITSIEYNPVHKTLMVARVNTTGGVNITINGLSLETLVQVSEMVYASTGNHPNIASPVTNDKMYFNPADSILWFARNVSTGPYILNARLSLLQPPLVLRKFNSEIYPRHVYGFSTLNNRLFTLCLTFGPSLIGPYTQLVEMDSLANFSGLGSFLFFPNGRYTVTVFAHSKSLKRLYCADYANHTFMTVDPFSTQKLRKTLGVAAMPTNIGISPVNHQGYTLNRSSSSISAINLSSEVVSKIFNIGFQPKNYEGGFVANYNPNYQKPEIESISSMVAQAGDTIHAFGKKL
ncbi:MAG: hypothetical protein MUE99_05865, partial [Chitinophagaceae bacterium]|nr:hypothetical protein [Chitinophagaceae bacterium]